MVTRTFHQAILDFRRARRDADRERRRARLRGESADLLSYEQVRQMLRGKAGAATGLKEIPLDAIVGSVGRYADFTRSFLPLQDSDEERWARVELKNLGLDGLPPIEVYQVGEAYFVRDGNHRVSVARRLGATHIQAYVTQIDTRVPLSPNVQPDDLILKAEYTDFLERTRLDEVRPGASLEVTLPGTYPELLEHIEVHRYFMGLEQECEIPHQEAVADWYDRVYLPVVDTIREQGVLQRFPGRTEADLYLWLSRHRAELEDSLGWEIEPEAAAADLVDRHGPGAQQRMQRLTGRLLDALTPDQIEGGPAPGAWRRERFAIRRDDCMFADILVPVSGDPGGWPAVAQAVEIACRESARLLGLHVVPPGVGPESERVRAVRAEFTRQCEALGVGGKLAVETGRVARAICDRGRWADLVVAGLAHPPQPQPVARLSSGFSTLIRRCPTPLLAVPGAFSPLDRPLLAYDGSPKAKEALYIAAYLAARGQDAGTAGPLVILTVAGGGRVTADTLAEAKDYVESRGVRVTPLLEHAGGTGSVAETILSTAEAHDSDLILMGGYGYSPVVEVVLGSAVDEVLRASRQPVLICR
jgi:nucleotide-binding universal stress UspA family protein